MNIEKPKDGFLQITLVIQHIASWLVPSVRLLRSVLYWSARQFYLVRREKVAGEAEAPNPARMILTEYEDLNQWQQDQVARNLALLWRSFHEAFGGTSGFLESTLQEQNSYLETLRLACERFKETRETERAYYYTSVALMEQYVRLFQSNSNDEAAIRLARCVSDLINRAQQVRVTTTE
jgi:hypothetical protein